jgi:hypothetical protein
VGHDGGSSSGGPLDTFMRPVQVSSGFVVGHVGPADVLSHAWNCPM